MKEAGKMFKTLLTLCRGATHAAEQEFIDNNAHLLLQQQMRDAGREVAAARQSVAVAIAQNRQEQVQHEKLLSRLAELESRTLEAIAQDRQDLAREAAEMIALMEAERDASQEAQSQFVSEITRLKANVRSAESKLRELQRGQRIAAATSNTQKLRSHSPDTGMSSLGEAEATLTRLRARQTRMDLTDQALTEMAQTGDPQTTIRKLAEAGCGAPQKTSADDVLARLTRKTKNNKKPGRPAA